MKQQQNLQLEKEQENTWILMDTFSVAYGQLNLNLQMLIPGHGWNLFFFFLHCPGLFFSRHTWTIAFPNPSHNLYPSTHKFDFPVAGPV